jgi:hypothetical protein
MLPYSKFGSHQKLLGLVPQIWAWFFLQLNEEVHPYIKVVPNSKSSQDMKCGQAIKGL